MIGKLLNYTQVHANALYAQLVGVLVKVAAEKVFSNIASMMTRPIADVTSFGFNVGGVYERHRNKQ